MKSSNLPKLQGGKRSVKTSKANKNSGISRTVSPLRDQHADRKAQPHPPHPPGESANHHVEIGGNRYGK